MTYMLTYRTGARRAYTAPQLAWLWRTACARNMYGVETIIEVVA